jgi:hypothetical protein
MTSMLPGEEDVVDLPDGFGPTADDIEELDLSDGLRLNISDREASAESLDEVPAGKYLCYITGVTVQRSKSEKNLGKPMYNFEFTVQPSVPKYAGRKMFTIACLWAGVTYTIVQIHRALGLPVGTDLQVLPPQQYVGKELIIRRGMGKATVGNGTSQDPQYPARLEVKGFFPASASATSGPSAGSDDLLPG